MTDYAVNVRAVVRATRTDPDATGDIPGWEVYGHEAGEEENEVVVRCDQLVRVEAGDKDIAIQKAKDDAGTIAMEGHEIDSIELWVDPAIDVDPEFAQASAPGM